MTQVMFAQAGGVGFSCSIRGDALRRWGGKKKKASVEDGRGFVRKPRLFQKLDTSPLDYRCRNAQLMLPRMPARVSQLVLQLASRIIALFRQSRL